MARIRTIKPEFFRHGELYDIEKSSGLPIRIAFAGLWTVCDRAGRFKWRPRELKIEILPHDQLNFEAVLNCLAEHGFVIKYESDGKQYGYVPTFLEHQHPHVKEPASTIPAPCEHGASTVPIRKIREGKGREGEVCMELKLDDFDPPAAFEELCRNYTKAERGLITQQRWQEAIEYVIRVHALERREDANGYLIRRAKLYCELVELKYQKGLTKWLEGKVFEQPETAWGAKEAPEGNWSAADEARRQLGITK